MDVPASHQGRFRPDRKNSWTLDPARRAKATPMKVLNRK
jgi:hypothetical protein